MADKRLSGSSHCDVAVKKANRTLGYIAESIEYKSKNVKLALYNSFVRSHLLYPLQGTVLQERYRGSGTIRDSFCVLFSVFVSLSLV